MSLTTMQYGHSKVFASVKLIDTPLLVIRNNPQKESKKKHGTCPLCGRVVHLTFHHLIPRKMHRRTFFRKHFDKAMLNQGIEICRMCHTGLHKRYDEMTLAKHYDTLDKILADPELQQHFAWVAKQKHVF